jgi:hypothetical protein
MLKRTFPPASATLPDMQIELRKRRALLNSQAGVQVQEAIGARYGDRAETMKWYDVAANPYPWLHDQLAALYNDEIAVSGGDGPTIAAVKASGHWGAMQHVQRDTLALREVAVLLEVPEKGRISTRTVFPDLWDDIRGCRDQPREIARIAFWVESPGNDDTDWELWEYQIEDEAGNPAPRWSKSLLTQSKGSLEEVEVREGEEYPCHTPGGAPFIPLCLYHAADTSRIQDWQTGTDIVTGAISSIIDSTAVTFAFDDACYRMPYVIDLEPVGATVENGRVKLSAAPGSFLRFQTPANSQGGRPEVGVVDAPADPEAMGITQADMTRSSAEVKSAASLVVSSAQRAELQRRQKPVFQPADQRFLTIAGWLLGVDVDPQAWKIEYPAVQLDENTLIARQQVVADGFANGTMTELEAVKYLHPSFTEAEARAHLATAKAELLERRLAAQPPPSNPSPTA